MITTISWLLDRGMKFAGIRTNSWLNILLSDGLVILLYIRYGASYLVIQGLLIFWILLYGSWSDITSHEVSDKVWMFLLLVGVFSIPRIGIFPMVAGMVALFVPLLLLGIICPAKAFGGADIKASATIAFSLGFMRGSLAFFIGLVIAVIIIPLYRKVKHIEFGKAFALIPFLSIGAILALFI